MTSPIALSGPSPVEETTPHRRIRLGSRALSVLFTVLLAASAVVAAVILIAAMAQSGPWLQICPHFAWVGAGKAPAGCTPVAALPIAHRLAYALVAAIRWAPLVMILWNLRDLFRLYGKGVIFARENAGHLKAIGLWLVAAAATPLLGHLFLGATGFEIDKTWFHLGSVQELVLGALVFVIAQVMMVGHELEEEQGRFV